METQEKKEYSGTESSRPSRILPYLLKATKTRKKKNIETERIKNQLIFSKINILIEFKIFKVCSGKRTEKKQRPKIINKAGIIIVGEKDVYFFKNLPIGGHSKVKILVIYPKKRI